MRLYGLKSKWKESQDLSLEPRAWIESGTSSLPKYRNGGCGGIFKAKTKTDESRRVIQLVMQIKVYLNGGEPDEFVVGGSKPMSYEAVRSMRERIAKDIAFDEPILPSRFRTTVLTDIYDRTKDC